MFGSRFLDPASFAHHDPGWAWLCWSAATIGFVESTEGHDDDNNRLCPPVVFSGDAADLGSLAHAAMQGLVARARDEAVGEWSARSRLNPARAAFDHLDQPDVTDSLAFMIQHTREALKNLERTIARESRN